MDRITLRQRVARDSRHGIERRWKNAQCQIHTVGKRRREAIGLVIATAGVSKLKLYKCNVRVSDDGIRIKQRTELEENGMQNTYPCRIWCRGNGSVFPKVAIVIVVIIILILVVVHLCRTCRRGYASVLPKVTVVIVVIVIVILIIVVPEVVVIVIVWLSKIK